MDFGQFAGWQDHPQDIPPSQLAYTPPYNAACYLPLGPSLAETVAQNKHIPSFAEDFKSLNSKCASSNHVFLANRMSLAMQNILASGRFQQYLHHTDSKTFGSNLGNVVNEGRAFTNKQHQEIQSDLPYLAAFDCEIQLFELQLNANNVQSTSTIGLTEQQHPSNKTHELRKRILHMMQSRAALMKQDVNIRKELLSVEVSISNLSLHVLPLLVRIHFYMVSGVYDDATVKAQWYEQLKRLTPLDLYRKEKRVELQRCRETRAALETGLEQAKARVLSLEQAQQAGLSNSSEAMVASPG